MSKYLYQDTYQLPRDTQSLYSGKTQQPPPEEMIMVNITSDKTYWHHVPPRMIDWDGHMAYLTSLIKMHYINLTIRKHPTDPICEISYKNNWPVLSKVSRSQKTRKDRSCHRLKETKETGSLSGMWDPGLEPGTRMSIRVACPGGSGRCAGRSLSQPPCCTNIITLACATMGKRQHRNWGPGWWWTFLLLLQLPYCRLAKG